MVGRPLASQIFVGDGLLKCIRPVCGAKLLAIMESASLVYKVGRTQKGSHSHAGFSNGVCDGSLTH
jgi:hypothetical protein